MPAGSATGNNQMTKSLRHFRNTLTRWPDFPQAIFLSEKDIFMAHSAETQRATAADQATVAPIVRSSRQNGLLPSYRNRQGLAFPFCGGVARQAAVGIGLDSDTSPGQQQQTGQA